MRSDKVSFLLVASLITISPALGQRNSAEFLNLSDSASAGRRISSEPIRRWEKPDITSHPGLTRISTEGLVGYWPFSGNADDESGNGNDGTVFGGAFLTEDRFDTPNSAYFFDGVDDYISAGESEILNMDTSMSMMAWIKPHVVHTSVTNSIILNKEGEYEFARFIDDVIRYAIRNSYPGWYWVPSGYEAPPDEWSHIAVVYDEGLTTVYVNGAAFFIFSGSGPIVDYWPQCNELRFGNRSWCESGPQLFHGVIDDIRVYNRAISAEEVMEIYNEIPDDPLAQLGICYGSTGSAEPTNPGALITIDPLTGAGTLVGPTGIIGEDGPAVRALAIKSTGEMYAMSNTASSDLYSVNASTGAGTFVANTGLLRPGDIVFDANDILYAVDETNILYTVDEVTGTRTVVGSTGVTLGGLACDATDGTMYASGTNDDIYTIDVETGAATLVGTTGLGGNIPDIHFDQAGNLYGTKRGASDIYDLIAIDKTTGAGTVIGSTGFAAVVGLATRLDNAPRTHADDQGHEDNESELPTVVSLFNNYPNPFNPSTTIRYALTEATHVSLRIYNTLGQLVGILVDENQVAGYHEVIWDGRNVSGGDVASGMYIYKIAAGEFVATKRMLLLR